MIREMSDPVAARPFRDIERLTGLVDQRQRGAVRRVVRSWTYVRVSSISEVRSMLSQREEGRDIRRSEATVSRDNGRYALVDVAKVGIRFGFG